MRTGGRRKAANEAHKNKSIFEEHICVIKFECMLCRCDTKRNTLDMLKNLSRQQFLGERATAFSIKKKLFLTNQTVTCPKAAIKF